MKTIDMMNMAAELVEFGRKNGASQMEVSLRRGTEFSVEVREGEIEKLTEAGSQGLYLRLFVDTKMARANSSDLTPETLQKLVKNAIVRARLASAGPAGRTAGEGTGDRRLQRAEDLRPGDRGDGAGNEDRPGQDHGGGRTGRQAGQQELRGVLPDLRSARCSSRIRSGFQGTYRRTSCSCGVSLQAGEGTNLFDEGWYDNSTSLAKLEAPEAIAKKAVHRVTRLIGARKVPTQNVRVVLEPEMTGSLLDFFGTCVDGENVVSESVIPRRQARGEDCEGGDHDRGRWSAPRRPGYQAVRYRRGAGPEDRAGGERCSAELPARHLLPPGS